jgi:EAL domain-containing protein (putative c-di-GMP-specific phosphodiesterase class I)
VLSSLADLAARLGSRAVAEVIEDDRDLAAVVAAGIDLAQGFLLCRPATAQRLKKLLPLTE